MKIFTNTGNIGSHDIVHIQGSKSDYTITELDGKLIYESSTHKYIVDDIEIMGFIKTGNVFKWLDEYEPFLNYGLTADRPFDTLSQITNVGHSGTVALWTTFGGALITPIQVLMNFNDGVTPWFSIGFDFSGSAWGDAEVGNSVFNGGYNNESMSGYGVTTSSNVGSFKWGDSNNEGGLDIGFGLQSGFSLIGKTSWDGNYYPGTDYPVFYGPFEINYLNPATGINFTLEQLTALRNTVTSISDKTPFIAWHGDTDGNAPTSTFNATPTTHKGHNLYIKDTSNNWFSLLTRGSSPTNTGAVATITRDSYNIVATGGNSLVGSTTQPTGLYTNGLILPTEIKPMIGTGGGVGFGAYHNESVSPKINGKTIFLVR